MSDDGTSWCPYCEEETSHDWDSRPYGWCKKCHIEDAAIDAATRMKKAAKLIRDASSMLDSALRIDQMRYAEDLILSAQTELDHALEALGEKPEPL